jgi:dTDP-glucose 4,6-dehydratase
MKLLVTGGAGFISSNFVRYWIKKYPQDKIAVFDLLTYAGHLESLNEVKELFSLIKGDITDPTDVDKAMEGIDYVIHFAAESHVDRSIADPAVFVRTNILGTQILLDAAKKHGVKRFHHISTDEVFGSLDLGSSSKFDENTRYDPHSPYAASKASSDHLVRAYHDTFDLPISITNCANNYGPFQDPEKFIPRLITNLIDGEKIPVYGDGKYVRDWLYVDDHCRAIDLVFQKGKIGDTYCVGSMTQDISNLEIAKKVISLMGKTQDSIQYVKDRPGHDRRYAIDWSKIRNDLGWKPEFDFDTYLLRTIDWYQNNQDWWRPLKKRAESIY